MDKELSCNLHQDGEEGFPGTHSSQDSEEGPFGTLEDLNEDDLANIDANYVHMAENLEEIMCNTMWFDEYTVEEFKNLRRLVADMRMPLYPIYKEKYTTFLATLKFLWLKATNHWTNQSFQDLLDLLIWSKH